MLADFKGTDHRRVSQPHSDTARHSGFGTGQCNRIVSVLAILGMQPCKPDSLCSTVPLLQHPGLDLSKQACQALKYAVVMHADRQEQRHLCTDVVLMSANQCLHGLALPCQ